MYGVRKYSNFILLHVAVQFSQHHLLKRLYFLLVYSCLCQRLHIYSGMSLSHKKEQIWVFCSDVDGSRICHTEWSNSKREKQILYINTCMWNLERWYRWTYSQGRSRNADKENGHVDTTRGGEGWTHWETGLDISLPCGKQRAGGKLLSNTGSSARCSVMT